MNTTEACNEGSTCRENWNTGFDILKDITNKINKDNNPGAQDLEDNEEVYNIIKSNEKQVKARLMAMKSDQSEQSSA